MRQRVLADTGPLVALINKRDRHHAWAADQATRLPAPFLTCEAVLSEACFLLQHMEGSPSDLLDLVARGVLRPSFDLREEIEPVQKLIKKYADQPMSLADACLVRMSEQIADSLVFTLDRDFSVYRRLGRRVIPTIAPWSRKGRRAP